MALSVGLVAILVLRPYLTEKKRPPRIEDRLPDADFIGSAFILDVARESSGMLFYHKVPFRDLLSQEFILSQAKLYGIDLQRKTYFFANENGEWGGLFHVNDSTKIKDGIERIKKFIEVRDSNHLEQRVYIYKKERIYLTYSNQYVFVYRGSAFEKFHKRVLLAAYGQLSPMWKKFFTKRKIKNEPLLLFTQWKKLKEKGVKSVLFSHDVDSTLIRLKVCIESEQPLNVRAKKGGLSLVRSNNTEKHVQLHVNATGLRTAKEDPIINLLEQVSSRIRFPFDPFFNAWEGDLSFQQGGMHPTTESFIESVLDDNFNVSEVRKTKVVMVPGFSLALSVNDAFDALLRKLFAKGIMTKDGAGFRVLFSPRLYMTKKDQYVLFHSSQMAPKLVEDDKSYGKWKEAESFYQFSMDSISRNELFGSMYFPVKKILKRNRFF